MAVARVLTEAFADDPVLRWLITSDARWARHAPSFFTAVTNLELPRGRVWVAERADTGEPGGVSIWAAPGQWRTPVLGGLRHLPRMLWAYGRGGFRALRALRTNEHHHPTVEHWYLAVLGSAPILRGHGYGHAALEAGLQQADDDGLPCYLESSKQSNLAFYARHGFEVTGTWGVGPGGPAVWGMWREPRP